MDEEGGGGRGGTLFTPAFGGGCGLTWVRFARLVLALTNGELQGPCRAIHVTSMVGVVRRRAAYEAVPKECRG